MLSLLFLLPFIGLAAAQGGYIFETSTNLTLVFSRDEDGCLDPNNATDHFGLVFSTASLPVQPTCLNLNTTFLPNQTSGFTGSGFSLNTLDGLVQDGVNWTIADAAAFDNNRNYSHIYYHATNGSQAEAGAGKDASRYVIFYPNRDCAHGFDSVNNDSFAYSCQSPEEGVCHTTPYNVQSFSIQIASAINADGNCLNWTKEGAAARVGGVWLLMLVAALMSSVALL